MVKFIRDDIKSINDAFESTNKKMNKNKKAYISLIFYFIAIPITPIMLKHANSTLSIMGIILFLLGCICGIVAGIKVLRKK